MAQLNQEVRYIVTVLDATGTLRTGLTSSDFTASVLRDDGAEDLTADSATVTISEIDAATYPGRYWAYFTPATATGLHLLRVVEGDFSSSLKRPHEFQVDVASGYAPSSGTYLTTRTNVKTALAVSDDGWDAIIDALLGQVTDLFEGEADTSFLEATETEYYDGRQCRELVLDRAPVSSVSTVHVSTAEPRAYGSDELLTADTHYMVDGNILHRLGASCWPRGPRVVRVAYTAGYAIVPGDLERAAIETIAVKLYKGKDALYHLQSVSAAGAGGAVLPPLDRNDIPPGARAVLDRYTRCLV